MKNGVILWLHHVCVCVLRMKHIMCFEKILYKILRDIFQLLKKSLTPLFKLCVQKSNWYKNSHQHGVDAVDIIAMVVVRNLLASICYVLGKSFL